MELVGVVLPSYLCIDLRIMALEAHLYIVPVVFTYLQVRVNVSRTC